MPVAPGNIDPFDRPDKATSAAFETRLSVPFDRTTHATARERWFSLRIAVVL
jgi:hypothetical protein